MSAGLGRWLVASASCVLMGLVAAPGAFAATTVGADGDSFRGTCSYGSPGATAFPFDGGTYAVPSAGVLTSWRIRLAKVSEEGQTFKFKLGRGDLDIRIVAETAAIGTSDTTVTQAARIPVQAGDRLGVWLPTKQGNYPASANVCQVADPRGDLDLSWGEVAVDQSARFIRSTDAGLAALSALVEPDADGDGYGDESQDSCPTSATVHEGACPPPPPANSGSGSTVSNAGVGTSAVMRDTAAPIISQSKLSASVFAVNTKATASRVARGSRLDFNLSEAATVVFVTEQRVKGKWRKVRIFGKRFGAGKNTLGYSGKIKPRGKQRALKPGRYRIRMRPSDRAGNKGIVSTVGFTIAG